MLICHSFQRKKREIANVSSAVEFAEGIQRRVDAGIMILYGAFGVHGRCGASRVHRRVRARTGHGGGERTPRAKGAASKGGQENGSGEDAEKRMVLGGDGRGREGRHRLRHPGITQNCLAARVELTA